MCRVPPSARSRWGSFFGPGKRGSPTLILKSLAPRGGSMSAFAHPSHPRKCGCSTAKRPPPRKWLQLVPFADDVARLLESRRRLESVDGKAAATALPRKTAILSKARAALEAGLRTGAKDEKRVKEKVSYSRCLSGRTPARRIPGRRIAEIARGLVFKTFDGYDPVFAWWTREPYKQFAVALEIYGNFSARRRWIDPRPRTNRSSAIRSGATDFWRN